VNFKEINIGDMHLIEVTRDLIQRHAFVLCIIYVKVQITCTRSKFSREQNLAYQQNGRSQEDEAQHLLSLTRSQLNC
jgi:hypothetical protein